MEPSHFQPVPRLCPNASGRILHPRPAPPWTLPPTTGEHAQTPSREVECFACRKKTSVPATAVSARCSHCAAYIKLDDVSLHSRTHRTKVQTCGSVTVQANTDLKGIEIECRDLIMHGKASGNIQCHGVCKIKTDQHISGRLSARRLTVEKRITVLVTHGIQADNVRLQGTLEGTLSSQGTVMIHKNAKLLGDITARRLIIEEGGIHHGDFTKLT